MVAQQRRAKKKSARQRGRGTAKLIRNPLSRVHVLVALPIYREQPWQTRAVLLQDWLQYPPQRSWPKQHTRGAQCSC